MGETARACAIRGGGGVARPAGLFSPHRAGARPAPTGPARASSLLSQISPCSSFIQSGRGRGLRGSPLGREGGACGSHGPSEGGDVSLPPAPQAGLVGGEGGQRSVGQGLGGWLSPQRGGHVHAPKCLQVPVSLAVTFLHSALRRLGASARAFCPPRCPFWLTLSLYRRKVPKPRSGNSRQGDKRQGPKCLGSREWWGVRCIEPAHPRGAAATQSR